MLLEFSPSVRASITHDGGGRAKQKFHFHSHSLTLEVPSDPVASGPVDARAVGVHPPIPPHRSCVSHTTGVPGG